jgi:hypothetical protein
MVRVKSVHIPGGFGCNYSKDVLVLTLSQLDWKIKSDTVQGCWSKIKKQLDKDCGQDCTLTSI